MAKDLTEGSPARVIFIYSLPIILGNIFQQLYNMADTAIIGRFVGYEALAGVGAIGGMSFFALGFVLGTTGGFGIKVAQAFGSGDRDAVRRSTGISLTLSTLIAIALTMTTMALTTPLLHAMGVPEDIFPYARTYIMIIFAGLLPTMAYNIISCILRGIGDSSTPLYFLIFSSVLNIALDLVAVTWLRWGVAGAALATVVAQGVSAILCFAYAFRRYPWLKPLRKDYSLERKAAGEHLSQGLPMALQFSITAIGLILLQAALVKFPSTYVAGFTAANKVQNVGFLVATAFGVAIANFAGQNYGAGNPARVRAGVRATMGMTLTVCLVCSVVMAWFADTFTALFMDAEGMDAASTAEMFRSSRIYLYASAIFFPFLYALLVYRNVLQGIGLTFVPLMAGVLELAIRCVGSFVLPPLFGYYGIISIDPLAWIGACVLLALYYYTVGHKKLAIN